MGLKSRLKGSDQRCWLIWGLNVKKGQLTTTDAGTFLPFKSHVSSSSYRTIFSHCLIMAGIFLPLTNDMRQFSPLNQWCRTFLSKWLMKTFPTDQWNWTIYLPPIITTRHFPPTNAAEFSLFSLTEPFPPTNVGAFFLPLNNNSRYCPPTNHQQKGILFFSYWLMTLFFLPLTTHDRTFSSLQLTSNETGTVT